jgi:hypothetical protein
MIQHRLLHVFQLLVVLCAFLSIGFASPAPASAGKTSWTALIAQAEALALPVRFLRAIPPDFITLEFEDLHTFAAEYHPEEHRMLLNLSLSFNGAGGALRPLAEMTHREVGTLYHELFHAYMDYLASNPEAAGPDEARLLRFARDRQHCQYEVVRITPVVQKRSMTEPRFLNEQESWEALNETWGVFVGWAVWTKLELSSGRGVPKSLVSQRAEWLKRLKKADRDGDLTGYYEPQDPAERAIARKRYLALSLRITPREVAMLSDVLFGESKDDVRRSASIMEQHRFPVKDSAPCQD